MGRLSGLQSSVGRLGGLVAGAWRGLRDWFVSDYRFIVPVAIGFWAVWTWADNDRRVAEERRIEAERSAQLRTFEARKPFLERQLAVHFELVQLVGRLVALEPGRPGWEEAERRLEALRWGELAMLTSREVRLQMAAFARALGEYRSSPTDEGRRKLRTWGTALANEVRAVVDETWTPKRLSVEHVRAIYIGSDPPVELFRRSEDGKLEYVGPRELPGQD